LLQFIKMAISQKGYMRENTGATLVKSVVTFSAFNPFIRQLPKNIAWVQCYIL